MLNVLVQYLRSADKIVVLGQGGIIEEQGSFDEVNSGNGFVQSLMLRNGTPFLQKETVTFPEKPEILEAIRKSIARNDDNLNRRTGDFSIYQYYFKSIGWRHGLFYLGLSTCYIFFYKFPRKVSGIHILPYMLITRCIEVWLEFWTTAEKSPSGANSPYYLGIYGLLTGLSIITMVVTIWRAVTACPTIRS